ncbi:MAG: hypothetical protein D5R99_00420 [Methanocalculus sp. MSAO_Arc1]|uniref:hypothetical protein n=1 Tax=Methanocalculus TaxID=71151 RepID=UPI000FF7C4E0|nr:MULTISPECIES: hypothetical protein [unclassified Methanocalculus]MCP1661840.1 hypothetical protein [Methanocalculus sp. AMF5]RQD81973.1 MAG: hypothetical protein D5R99_00420 [Methanocalculus sp. MSAO_Arc1]
MAFEALYGLLAIITLVMGAVLNVLVYLSYTRVKEQTLLLFNLGLFLLVIGIVFSDIVSMIMGEGALAYWSIVISRLLQIAGIGCMITGVLR